MRQKVILFGPLPPPYGGVSVYISYLVEHLRAFDAKVWAVLGDHTKRDPQIRYIRHRRLGVIPALLREARGARILDATHFHLEYPHPLLLSIWLAGKFLLGFEWYKNIHDGSLPARQREFNFLQRALFRLAIRSTTEFIVVSEELKRWLQEEIKVRQNVTLIPSLLRIPPTLLDAPLSKKNETALASYLSRPHRVCSIGVFIPDYGFRHAADAVETLRRETGEDVGLLLLDGTFACDEKYRAETLKGREWITVLENVPNREVYQVMRRSDAFIRAVAREGYGISRVEALWCGLPVVATDVGETRGMLTSKFGDVAELTAQLRRALSGNHARDASEWAARFSSEAEENLRALIEKLFDR